MSPFFVARALVLLITVLSIQAQKNPSINIDSKCLGNVLRLSIGPLKGSPLEVEAAINNTADVISLTPDLASQCGYSMKVDPMGNAMVFVSLQNCFAHNMNDETFTAVTHLRLQGNHMTEDELYIVNETCSYTRWASREILCDRNYIEVSVRRTIADNTQPERPIPGQNKKPVSWRATKSKAAAGGFHITTVVLFTPEQRVMTVDQLQRTGYGIGNSPTRLVLRSPQNAPEIYPQNIAGVTMMVFRTSTIFEKKWLSTQIEASAACPTPASLSFTQSMITWYMPRRMDPLVSTNHFQILEVHMGVDGMRLGADEMAARQYSMSITDLHIIIEIPVGAVGGYFKSHVQDGQYLTSYCIEPMLELLWIEDDPHEDTRYKVLFPITTPLTVSPVEVIDNTVPEERMFKVKLGTFCQDVQLMNITLSDGVLSMTECHSRGFDVEEQRFPNGSKTFRLSVPFSDSAVLQERGVNDEMLHYTLNLIFGLAILPEYTSFAYVAVLEVALTEMVPPSATGSCDRENFYVTVKYGSRGLPFHTVVGKSLLDHEQAQHFGLISNDTHFSIAVPFSAPECLFESIWASSIRSRLDVRLSDPVTNVTFQEFSLGCSFLSALTECFSNGTMTALAVKTDSVSSLNPSQLTLRDPACGPTYSDDRFAYFVFTGISCGTTRKFLSNVMLYENEISLPDELAVKTHAKAEKGEERDADYFLLASCYYVVNTTHTVAFLTSPRNKEPYADIAHGQLLVSMRLARDASYNQFHEDADYPVVKYLRQPLYFEVELTRSTDPKVALVLEHCWATLHEDRASQPRWSLIVNGCENPDDPYQVVFHPVLADARVQHPSLFKRFEAQMFSFSMDEDNLTGRVFVHCDVIICDASSPKVGPCTGQCVNQRTRKGKRHAVPQVYSSKHVTSGPILMLSK